MENTARHNIQCDRYYFQTPGWYRFQGAAGNRMPNTCPPTRRCGTNALGWLDGQHPSVLEGVVTRKVCYHWENNCCKWSNNIKIRNCGGYYVYELIEPPSCSLRYCVNKQGEYYLSVYEAKNFSSLYESL